MGNKPKQKRPAHELEVSLLAARSACWILLNTPAKRRSESKLHRCCMRAFRKGKIFNKMESNNQDGSQPNPFAIEWKSGKADFRENWLEYMREIINKRFEKEGIDGVHTEGIEEILCSIDDIFSDEDIDDEDISEE